MKHRVLTPEHMDDPDVPPSELETSLAYLRALNRRFGGQRGLIDRLEHWSRRWNPGQPITLLDVGTGSGDIPLAACAWARRRGFVLRVTAVDLHPRTVEAARRQVEHEPLIEVVQADAAELDRRFAPGSFDYAHAGLFLHHLPDDLVVRVLSHMRTLASRGVVWNDLVRSRASLVLAHAATLGRPSIIRHDAIVSVRAGFTKAEALDLARQAGIASPRYATRWIYRFVLWAGGARGLDRTPGDGR